MRKIISICICLVLATAQIGWGAQYSQERALNNASVATENTVTTSVFPIGGTGAFSCWVDVDTPTGQAGISNINIWAEYSYDKTATNFAKTNPYFPIAASFTSTEPTIFPFTDTTAKFIRFKVEGVKDGIDTGNTTGTTITMYFMKREL